MRIKNGSMIPEFSMFAISGAKSTWNLQYSGSRNTRICTIYRIVWTEYNCWLMPWNLEGILHRSSMNRTHLNLSDSRFKMVHGPIITVSASEHEVSVSFMKFFSRILHLFDFQLVKHINKALQILQQKHCLGNVQNVCNFVWHYVDYMT